MLVCSKSSVATKKGNKLGITEVAHSDKPDFTAIILDFEYIIKKTVNIKNENGIIFFLNFKIFI